MLRCCQIRQKASDESLILFPRLEHNDYVTLIPAFSLKSDNPYPELPGIKLGVRQDVYADLASIVAEAPHFRRRELPPQALSVGKVNGASVSHKNLAHFTEGSICAPISSATSDQHSDCGQHRD